jgi:asparagine synthase (glutamine-hydrolysing)
LPGHTLVWRDGEIETDRYWELSFKKSEARMSDSQYVERFGELFSQCVESHLMADAPLGMFLSGGIDSSAIAAVMSRLAREPIKTFSVAFAERDANELEYARAVARAFKTDHHEILVSPEQFFDRLPALVYQEDEPIAYPSSVPLYFVSDLAASRVKVALTGEGSDELLAGYNKYRVAIYNLLLGRGYERLTPAPLRRLIKKQIGKLSGESRARRVLERTFLFNPAEIKDLYFDNFAVYSPSRQRRLFTAETYERMRDRDPYRATLSYIEQSGAETMLDKLLAADLKTYLHELLMKQDQMSMAASIESRVPFLDHKLVEFAARMPDAMKLRGWTTKYVLRRAMRGLLPPQILTRKKMGFPTPVGNWFRGPFRKVIDEYVLSERATARGVFDRSYTREIAARHAAGENHTERLWMLVNFEIWQRRFFDGEYVG